MLPRSLYDYTPVYDYTPDHDYTLQCKLAPDCVLWRGSALMATSQSLQEGVKPVSHSSIAHLPVSFASSQMTQMPRKEYRLLVDWLQPDLYIAVLPDQATNHGRTSL